MKTLFTLILLVLGINTYGQFILNSKVLIDNQQVNEQVTVTIINSTDNINSVIEQKRNIKLELQYDKEYIIIVSKKGFKTKAISIDTYCNMNEPIKYLCSINLEKTNDKLPDATLVGGIYYNENKKQFDYYLK